MSTKRLPLENYNKIGILVLWIDIEVVAACSDVFAEVFTLKICSQHN